MKYQQQITNNNLKAMRLARGLFQKQVAKMLGFTNESRVSHWEKGDAVPSIVNLMKLSKIYEVLPHELYHDLYDGVVIKDQEQNIT